MPVIARFSGMVIKMYFQQAEHNPPHFHVICGECTGSIDIRTLEMLEGDLPSKELTLVKEWARHHQAALLEIWNTQKFHPIPPTPYRKERSTRQ